MISKLEAFIWAAGACLAVFIVTYQVGLDRQEDALQAQRTAYYCASDGHNATYCNGKVSVTVSKTATGTTSGK